MELKVIGRLDNLVVADTVFDRRFNESLVHQVVIAYLAFARMGTAAQKSRAAVSGGGRKPWRQKGTGRARAGSIRSPLWRGGGVTFAAKPRHYRQKVNKKMYRGAISTILSELIRQDRLLVIDDFKIKEAKTKFLVTKLKEYTFNAGLIIINQENKPLSLAARNLPLIRVCYTNDISPVDLIRCDKVLMTVEVIKKIQEWLA